MVFCVVVVDFYYVEVSGWVELDVMEEFVGVGDDKWLVGQGWYWLVEGDIVWFGVEICCVRFDICFIQMQCQVVVVVFVLVFQSGVGGGFDYVLDESGVDNGLYSFVFFVDLVWG